MVAYALDGGTIQHSEIGRSGRVPPELREALRDPAVERWAFNASFERTITRHVLGIETPYEGWRCTMALAYLQSFTGTLGDVGDQVGLPLDKRKDKDGKRLIRLFCQPQRDGVRRDEDTNPEDWRTFCDYNIQDVVAETEIKRRLLPYPIPDEEWALYELDQRINDNGLPIDLPFVRSAMQMVARRKKELTAEMRERTGLANPNSTQQLLPWLQDRGYPFADLQKATVAKVLNDIQALDAEAAGVLLLRAQASRTSVKKFDAAAQRTSEDGRLRHTIQFAGASRTARWSGRSFQPQNLPRTPKPLEEVSHLTAVTDCIREGDYDTLGLLVEEPMVALSGCVRSSIQSPPGHELVVADLSSIESSVIGWLSGCKRMLNVFHTGLDPYKSFGEVLYAKPYDEVTKAERNICKPAVLGCGFGLGGGEMRDGKKTGLWAYAESMGVHITKEEAARQVALFRSVYSEIPDFWKALELAIEGVLTNRSRTVAVGRLDIGYLKPYLVIQLPSGRPMYYYQPRMADVEFQGRDGPYIRRKFTYMGKHQLTGKWCRIVSGGPKVCLGADTEVLTNRGWKIITEVTTTDLVWDGGAWVLHGGVVFNGEQATIAVDGVPMTRDHLVLTEKGWTHAEKCRGLYRFQARTPESSVSGKAPRLESAVCLRKVLRSSTKLSRARSAEILRVSDKQVDNTERQHEARNVSASGLCCMALDVMPLFTSYSSSVAQLRGARHNRVQRMARQFRGVLGRYGSDLSQRLRFRAQEQQRQLQPRELCLGNAKGELQQSSQHSDARHAFRYADSLRGIKDKRYRPLDVALPTRPGMQPVFDIVNAGPQNRFVVKGKTGPLIVHNCENVVQATARETFKIGALRAAEFGFDIVGLVHDEIISVVRKGDNRLTLDALKECMASPIPWADGLPLGADGYSALIYRK